jgi:hypothetical protein
VGKPTGTAHAGKGEGAGQGGTGGDALRGWRDDGAAGLGGREKSGAAWWWGADMWAWPAQCRAARFKLGLKPVQNYSMSSNEI